MWGGLRAVLARSVTRLPRTQVHSRWNESHPKSAKAHFASAPQNMLPRRCWNNPRRRTPANPVDTTTRVTVCALAGHRLRPRAMALDRATATPLQPSPPKRAKGFEPSTFSLGNAGPRLCLCEKVPCGAPIGVDDTGACAVCAGCFVQSVYKCVQTCTVR